tara:strand:+ start:891 stop:1160 length:270 start_codon:yes stop_codon:yes gene_type:complete
MDRDNCAALSRFILQRNENSVDGKCAVRCAPLGPRSGWQAPDEQKRDPKSQYGGEQDEAEPHHDPQHSQWGDQSCQTQHKQTSHGNREL